MRRFEISVSLLRRLSLRHLLSSLALNTRPDSQDNARKLQRTPHGKLGWPVEHRAGTRNQLRAQHELRKLAQHRDRNFAAVSHPMKQSSGGPMDVGHWLNAIFVLDTVSEMGRFGAFAGLP